MNLEVNGAFVYYVIPILGGIPITQTTVSFTVVALVLVLVFAGAEPMKMATTALVMLIIQALAAFGLWLALQIMLMIRYDKNGNRKIK